METEHLYGANLHVSASPWLRSLLARIGSPETPIGEVPGLIGAAYRQQLTAILESEFPSTEGRRATRMAEQHPNAGHYRGPLLSPDTQLVIVAVIRGGVLPAQVCYEEAVRVLPPGRVRLDFLNMSRTTDAAGQVTGVRFDGSKIGGPVDDAVVLFPDPMGATGGTIARCIEVYAAMAGGPPKRIIASHLMVTPEAVQRLRAAYPELRIYAGRFDRGLSAADVLDTLPGTYPDREKGLDEHQYIVPGAGGIGELLTNSWV